VVATVEHGGVQEMIVPAEPADLIITTLSVINSFFLYL